MKSPFPGMDPYLEHPALWPDVYISLLTAISDAIVPCVAPKYYVGLERRAFCLNIEELVSVCRPDVAIGPVRKSPNLFEAPISARDSSTTVFDVHLPVDEQLEESYL